MQTEMPNDLSMCVCASRVFLFANEKKRHIDTIAQYVGWTERPPGDTDNCPHKTKNETQ